jgi:hypothetical protein
LQGGAGIVLPANGTRAVNILLVGGLGTVTAWSSIHPARRSPARVGGGFTGHHQRAGQFTPTDVPVGHRDIVAVSDTLGTSATAAVDLVRAGESAGVTIVLDSVASVAGVVTRADGTTPVPNVPVYVFRSVNSDDGPQIRIFGTATTGPNGGYRIDRLPMGAFTISVFDSGFTDGNIGKIVLKFHQQVFKADIKFRGAGGASRRRVRRRRADAAESEAGDFRRSADRGWWPGRRRLPVRAELPDRRHQHHHRPIRL